MAEMGRPKVIDEITLQKLEGAFANGATDEEACFVANISPGTLYNYQKQNPDFLQRKEGLKNMLKYQAKANIAESLRNNKKLEDSKWYLEKKCKKEFGNNLDITTDGKELPQPIIPLNDYVQRNDINEENKETE